MENRLGSGAEDHALPSPCPFNWLLRRLREGEYAVRAAWSLADSLSPTDCEDGTRVRHC